MCGICGYIGREHRSQVIAEMQQSLFHRGPDEGGEWRQVVPGHREVRLAMRRLSILDLAGGSQPIANEDGTLWIVFNGEIYNSPDLRAALEAKGHQFSTRTDTECIVHLYEEYGDACVEHLRGMFAFALWDSREERLLLARDRLGIKPLFYHARGGSLVFGSEIKSLLLHPDVPREVDLAALDRYLTFLYIPGPGTIFEGIRHLPPGCTLAWKAGQTRLQTYWELPEPGPDRHIRSRKEHDLQGAAEELRELLRESVRSHLLSDVPLGAFLSGGVDSSAVVAMMAETSSQQVKTFSIGFDVPEYDELRYARLVARQFGTDHHEEIVRPDASDLLPQLVWQLDQPFADSSILPTYFVSRLARSSVKVVLAGDGGDELFAGYGWTRAQALVERVRPVPGLLKRAAMQMGDSSGRGARVWDRVARLARDASVPPAEGFARRVTCFSPLARQRLYTPEVAGRLAGADSYEVLWPHLRSSRKHEPLASYGNQMLRADTQLYLPDDDLMKVDRMSMACSLEARVPLLDHRLVEFAARLPFHWKLRGTTTKYILKQAMKSHLPAPILQQRKQGFSIPVNHWMRTSLHHVARRLLIEDRPRTGAWLRTAEVSRLLDTHQSGSAHLGHQLWALLMTELWARTILDRTPTSIPSHSIGDII